MRHYNNVKDSPEVIALCVNCRMRRCPGICEKYREKIREARRKRAKARSAGDGGIAPTPEYETSRRGDALIARGDREAVKA